MAEQIELNAKFLRDEALLAARDFFWPIIGVWRLGGLLLRAVRYRPTPGDSGNSSNPNP